MATLPNIEIKLNEKMVEMINWYRDYKQCADDALSILVETDVPDNLKTAQNIALKALNIGAKEWDKND